jgi:hypothetical protein
MSCISIVIIHLTSILIDKFFFLPFICLIPLLVFNCYHYILSLVLISDLLLSICIFFIVFMSYIYYSSMATILYM